MHYPMILVAMLVLLPVAVARANEINSSAHATADTGGNTVEDGGSVTTGNANASVRVTTVSTDDADTETTVEVDANDEHVEKTFTNKGSVDVSVTSKPGTSTVTIETKPYAAVKTTQAPEETASTTAILEVQTNTNTPALFVTIADWVRGLLGFFFW